MVFGAGIDPFKPDREKVSRQHGCWRLDANTALPYIDKYLKLSIDVGHQFSRTRGSMLVAVRAAKLFLSGEDKHWVTSLLRN